MQIVKNSVVTLNYRVTDPDGNLVDGGAAPLIYLHGGYDGIFPKLEEALHGKNEGDKVEVRLEPDDAFGEYDDSLVIVESVEAFPDNIEIGMHLERVEEGEEDPSLYTITDIANGEVVVDGNHPLAGLTILFNCTVALVRLATAEEIAHGHPHDGMPAH
jgi:FKBP-type peptidyl-prolyl cis-trans isomerase SlyD